MTAKDVKIRVEEVCKVFGPNPQSVLDQVRDGIGKAELLESTGHVIGIRDVSLNVEAGETFVVMGLSGSGKSTLIRHFNRLIEPTSGRIEVDGVDVLGMNRDALRAFRLGKVSIVFQRFALLPHKTVLENIIYGLVIGGQSRGNARRRGMEQVELVGLEGFQDHYPSQLSGGMQQRVGLARALATDAEILLMDEAFSALDPVIRYDMQAQLRELQARLHKTIVFITHDLDEALQLGDHIAILKDGELRRIGTGSEILLQPGDDYVERFVRDVNRARVLTFGSVAETARPDRDIDIPERAIEIGHDVTLEEGFDLLARSGGVAVVIDGGKRPIGIVSAAMIMKVLARHDRAGSTERNAVEA